MFNSASRLLSPRIKKLPNVALLMPLDVFPFTDVLGHPVVNTNGVILDNSLPLFTRPSALFSGAAQYLQLPSSNDFNFGSNDMAVEVHFATTTATANMTLVGRNWAGLPYTGGWSIQVNGTGSTGFTIYWADYSISTPLMTSAVTSYRDGAWHYFKWSKKGNVHTMWLDNTQIATVTTTTVFGASAQVLSLGTDPSFGGRYFTGRMANLRISNGDSRFSEGVPTGPYPTF